MVATHPAVSGLLVVLALVTAPVCGAEQAPATSVTSPTTQEAPAVDLLAGCYVPPLSMEELGQVSGGALTLLSPEQLQQSAAGVKLWDEARMRPASTVDSGPGQIPSNVSVQQTLFH
ncbi:MAG: hypothetical protein P4L44_01810 [Oryzomonas sp.]|uniref:hypothetical protein n=1 Tax=Oryzomonas sp. TaxID=2855186 RepID=UPI002842887D|nr:hypothetical protein [Oryzomonas sp.]MDR3578679.1 hypothetical protein [Oryzomonas sp.]